MTGQITEALRETGIEYLDAEGFAEALDYLIRETKCSVSDCDLRLIAERVIERWH